MAAPTTYDDLSAHIARRHDKLSARLRTIAAFAVQHPNDVALSTVSVLAKRIGVQPSAIVRFANNLGYDGFTEMQQVFRTRLVASSMPSYRERISQLRNARDGQSGRPGDVLAEFVADDIASLENLYRLVPFERLEKAISLLAEAQTIYLFAQGRSFPVAYYLDYGLTRLDLRSHFLDSHRWPRAPARARGDEERRDDYCQFQGLCCRRGRGCRRYRETGNSVDRHHR